MEIQPPTPNSLPNIDSKTPVPVASSSSSSSAPSGFFHPEEGAPVLDRLLALMCCGAADIDGEEAYGCFPFGLIFSYCCGLHCGRYDSVGAEPRGRKMTGRGSGSNRVGRRSKENEVGERREAERAERSGIVSSLSSGMVSSGHASKYAVGRYGSQRSAYSSTRGAGASVARSSASSWWWSGLSGMRTGGGGGDVTYDEETNDK
jgi:hypothetical protein